MLVVEVKREHYFREGQMILELVELFQLYNQDALKISRQLLFLFLTYFYLLFLFLTYFYLLFFLTKISICYF
jgi:hypothetical protein